MKNKRQNKFLGYLKFVPQTKKVVEEKKPKEKPKEEPIANGLGVGKVEKVVKI